MQTIKASILINAPKETVWQVMLEDATYRQWTKAFNPGSFYQGSWEEGSEMRFVGKDEEGNLQGIYSRIRKHIPNEHISIEHLGLVKNNEVDTTSEQVKEWAPAFENYSVNEEDGLTRLDIEMQIDSKYVEMFEKMWETALGLVKELSEEV